MRRLKLVAMSAQSNAHGPIKMSNWRQPFIPPGSSLEAKGASKPEGSQVMWSCGKMRQKRSRWTTTPQVFQDWQAIQTKRNSPSQKNGKRMSRRRWLEEWIRPPIIKLTKVIPKLISRPRSPHCANVSGFNAVSGRSWRVASRWVRTRLKSFQAK